MNCRGLSWIIFYDIRLENSDGKSEIFRVESSDGEKLGLTNSKVTGVAYYSKFGK